MPDKSHVGGVNILGLVYLLTVLIVLFLPMVLGRGGSPPGQSEPDSDDGGGGGPPRPMPGRPRGGVPLDESDPARVRLRSHDRLFDRLPARARRRAAEPDRRRTRRKAPS